ESQGLSKLTPESASAIVHGTGILKGFMRFEVGREPMKFSGFGAMGLQTPKAPEAQKPLKSKDIASLITGILSKKDAVRQYVSMNGNAAGKRMPLIEAFGNIQQLIKSIVSGARRYSVNLARNMTMSKLLSYIDGISYVEGRGSLTEFEEDYRQSLNLINELSGRSSIRTVGDAIKYLETARIHRSDTYNMVMKTLRSYPLDTPMSIVKEAVSKQQAGDEALTSQVQRAMTPGEKDVFFWPDLNFVQGQPIDVSLIQDRIAPGSADNALGMLRQAKSDGRELSVTGHLRGFDLCGSSLDLPEFQIALTPEGTLSIEQIPSTPTIASAFKAKIRFSLADDENAIEYSSPDHGIPLDNPYKTTGPISLVYNKDSRKWETPNGQKDAAAFIFSNLFGLRGVKISCEGIDAMALAGGMESSNVVNVALIAAASMLSGANLSQADIFNLAVKLENDEFGGLTGGQGHLATLLGGAYSHTWLSGIKDAQGRLINPYSALSRQLLTEDELKAIEDHSMLVQAGKEYENGKPKVNRTAALINYMWTDLLRDRDEIGLPLHQEKLILAAKQYEGYKTISANPEAGFTAIVEAVERYAQIRDELCRRWMTLMLAAHQGGTFENGAFGSKREEEYAKVYADKVFNTANGDYEKYGVIRDIYNEYSAAGRLDELKNLSLYTLDPISSLVSEAKKQGIAIFPLGAGGPGTNLAAVSARGADHIQRFLESQGLSKLTPESASAIVHGTGILKGFMRFEVGREPMKFSGFGEMGLAIPTPTGTKTEPASRKKGPEGPDGGASAPGQTAPTGPDTTGTSSTGPIVSQDLPSTPPMAPVAGQTGMPESVLQARATRGPSGLIPEDIAAKGQDLETAERLLAVAKSYDFSRAPKDGINMSYPEKVNYVETTPYTLVETLSQIRMTPGEADKGVVIIASDTGMTRTKPGDRPEVNTQDVFKVAADLTGEMLGEKLVLNVRGTGQGLVDAINTAVSSMSGKNIKVRSVITLAGTDTANRFGNELQNVHENAKVLNIEDTQGMLIPVAALYELALAIGFELGDAKVLSCFNRIGLVLDANGNRIDIMDAETLRRLLAEKIIRILPVIRAVNTADHVAAQAAARKALVSL
ncbi:MAG: hypothetical protein KBB52_05420, partial [Candidatus Omnitrophica bacterium]|nr:hypothetical protein [Candidatus Omnitrophota bacterium]